MSRHKARDIPFTGVMVEIIDGDFYTGPDTLPVMGKSLIVVDDQGHVRGVYLGINIPQLNSAPMWLPLFMASDGVPNASPVGSLTWDNADGALKVKVS